MASTTTAKIHWTQKLHFHLTQAKHCVENGDFTYFHVCRAQYIANGVDHLATLQAQGVPDDDLDKFTGINVSTTETSEVATSELQRDFKATQIDSNLPEPVKKAACTEKLTEQNAVAKQKVVNAMDAGLDKAIDLISAMPASAQDSAASFFMLGMGVAMEALEVMVARISQLCDSIVEFIQKIWKALEKAWKAVSDKVSSCVRRLFGLKASAQTNGTDKVDGEHIPIFGNSTITDQRFHSSQRPSGYGIYA